MVAFVAIGLFALALGLCISGFLQHQSASLGIPIFFFPCSLVLLYPVLPQTEPCTTHHCSAFIHLSTVSGETQIKKNDNTILCTVFFSGLKLRSLFFTGLQCCKWVASSMSFRAVLLLASLLLELSWGVSFSVLYVCSNYRETLMVGGMEGPPHRSRERETRLWSIHMTGEPDPDANGKQQWRHPGAPTAPARPAPSFGGSGTPRDTGPCPVSVWDGMEQ
jgi:hypothetical protein